MARAHDERMRWARTEATRERIRRWSVVELVAGGIAITGVTLPFVTLGLCLLLVDAHGDGDGALLVLGLATGAGVLLLVAGASTEVHARQRLLEARFADGYVSIGRIDEVIEVSTEGQPLSTLIVTLTSPRTRPGIRRRLDSTMHPGGPGARRGGTMRIRHNTLDPRRLDDVLFVAFL